MIDMMRTAAFGRAMILSLVPLLSACGSSVQEFSLRSATGEELDRYQIAAAVASFATRQGLKCEQCGVADDKASFAGAGLKLRYLYMDAGTRVLFVLTSGSDAGAGPKVMAPLLKIHLGCRIPYLLDSTGWKASAADCQTYRT